MVDCKVQISFGFCEQRRLLLDAGYRSFRDIFSRLAKRNEVDDGL